MRFTHLSLMLLAAPLLSSCRTSTHVDAPQKLGGKWVSARTLNVGHDVYMNNCLQCHGLNGEGNGPAAQGNVPPPRNFTQGKFKFSSVAPGELPTDDDLKRTIRHGLRGTQMLPWDLTDERLEAVVQYIKTFSPVWRKEKAGTPQEVSQDPWGEAKREEAIAQGKKVYHGLAQCHSCHASFATAQEIAEYSKELTGTAITTLREKPWVPVPQASEYGAKFMPPDYTKDYIKTGDSPAAIYRILNSGVTGTTMAAWKNLLSPKADPIESERNQWAVAYYVSYLQSLKFNLKARQELLGRLKAANYGLDASSASAR